MVVGGPNQRTDYHVNEGEEFFYQVEGDMILKIINDKNEFEDIKISEGEIFLLPAKTPHSPQRFENTVGLVIERERREHEKDALQWYCQNCHNKIYEEKFHLTNIEKQFGAIFDRFYNIKENHTCSKCNTHNGK